MLMLEQHAHTGEADVVPVKEGVEAVVYVRDVVLYVDLQVKRTSRSYNSCKVPSMQGTLKIRCFCMHRQIVSLTAYLLIHGMLTGCLVIAACERLCGSVCL